MKKLYKIDIKMQEIQSNSKVRTSYKIKITIERESNVFAIQESWLQKTRDQLNSIESIQ